VVSQCKLVSGWGLRKRRSAPSYGPCGSGRTLRDTTYTLCVPVPLAVPLYACLPHLWSQFDFADSARRPILEHFVLLTYCFILPVQKKRTQWATHRLFFAVIYCYIFSFVVVTRGGYNPRDFWRGGGYDCSDQFSTGNRESPIRSLFWQCYRERAMMSNRGCRFRFVCWNTDHDGYRTFFCSEFWVLASQSHASNLSVPSAVPIPPVSLVASTHSRSAALYWWSLVSRSAFTVALFDCVLESGD